MTDQERNETETPCPRCGANAQWSYLNAEKTLIEVRCPDCGDCEMSREDFDQVVSEHTGIGEPEEG